MEKCGQNNNNRMEHSRIWNWYIYSLSLCVKRKLFFIPLHSFFHFIHSVTVSLSSTNEEIAQLIALRRTKFFLLKISQFFLFIIIIIVPISSFNFVQFDFYTKKKWKYLISINKILNNNHSAYDQVEFYKNRWGNHIFKETVHNYLNPGQE